MKKNKLKISAVCWLLLFVIALNLASCSQKVSAKDLMDGIDAKEVTPLNDLEDGNLAATDFAIRLFKANNTGEENTLISPLSVLCALAMTTNGAKGETLAQMESVLGMSKEDLNLYLYTYINSLPQGEKYKLSIANSIWFRDDERLTVKEKFLQTNADYYGAEIYKAHFNEKTVKDINGWVSEHTDGMIPNIIEEISPNVIMYLINALAFEADWSVPYAENKVRERDFTTAIGTTQKMEFMYSDEYYYLEDDMATGFIKRYADGKYAFVALLPNENVSLSDYVNSLDANKLYSMLSAPENHEVWASMPKFTVEYETEMSQILKGMGMTEPFDDANADFADLGESTEGNIYISRVIHKTFIEVAEQGTRAGAVTAVEMNDGGSAPTEIKEVYLNRPFLYMLVDRENNVPFFIGTFMGVTD